MDQLRGLAVAITAVLGVSFVAGFVRAFRDRLYLGLLGLAFVALAGCLAVSAPQLRWLQMGLLGLAGLFFLGGVYFAVVQTVRQIRLIQEHRAGLERQMWEYLAQLEQRAAQERAQQQSGEAPSQSPQGDDQ